MKNFFKLILIGVFGLALHGCSKKVTKVEPSPDYYSEDQDASKLEIAPKSKSFEFDNAEVVGYLDNPTPVYITDNKPSEEDITRKIKELGSKRQCIGQNHPSKQQSDDSPVMQQEQTQSQQKRMVTYDGFINSRSTKPDSLIKNAVSLAESLKGYVEVRNNSSVTLRIPVMMFGVIYDSLLKSGEVINYHRSAEDITDAFRDTDLRVTVLEKTIERYVKLIRLVEDDKEKIGLLKEIERLREELEVLRVQKSVLALRASYAKIQYSVEQITTGFFGRKLDNIQGFQWVSYLDPINPFRFGKRLNFEVPDGMVQLKERKFWISQSPAGSRVWTAQVANQPQGTSDFWIHAIVCEIREQFFSVDTNSLADYRFIHCIPQPGVNYRYSVGVKVVGKSINIIQCYFTDELQKNRYFDSVKKILMAEGGKS